MAQSIESEALVWDSETLDSEKSDPEELKSEKIACIACCNRVSPSSSVSGCDEPLISDRSMERASIVTAPNPNEPAVPAI